MLTEQQINEHLEKFFNKQCTNCEHNSFNIRRVAGLQMLSSNDLNTFYIAGICTQCGLTKLINEKHITDYCNKRSN